jgi:hypothetical protein
VKLVGDAVRVVFTKFFALARYGCARLVGASDFDDFDRLFSVTLDHRNVRAAIQTGCFLAKHTIAADFIFRCIKLLLGSGFQFLDLESMIRRSMRAVGIGGRVLSPSRRSGRFALGFGQAGGVLGSACNVSERSGAQSNRPVDHRIRCERSRIV